MMTAGAAARQRPARESQAILSPDTVARYRSDGFFVFEDALDSGETARLREIVDEMVDASRELTKSNAVYELEDGHSASEPRVRRIKKPYMHHPEFRRVIFEHPRLLAVLRAVLGPNVRLQSAKINMKSAGFGSPVEWHQDWAVYPHTNQDLLALGIMLDDCELDNGPLMILPGSHRGRVHDHHVDGYYAGAIDPDRSGIDFSKAVPCVGKAGSMSVHHVRAVHGSAPNLSTQDRRLLVLAYRAADAWPILGLMDEAGAGWSSDDSSLESFDSLMVCGETTIEPRMEAVPLRIPLPPARNQGSIYENQKGLKNRFFKA